MTGRKLHHTDIYEKIFKRAFRGYNIAEVDEFLDVIMRDYNSFQTDIDFLETENERLKAKIEELSQQTQGVKRETTQNSNQGVTNFDILKRLSNLERKVFDDRLRD
ncbi:cell division regulator GpsB [Atopobacter phocae]|uniref:cell division regulator GpsB n=1 Tax=Atopobacter phocae TaxID=136492 RepID=UPI0004B638C6|nr:cell division regulator GpsB [Atopobacter phocae]